jgi:hypothetical protein
MVKPCNLAYLEGADLTKQKHNLALSCTVYSEYYMIKAEEFKTVPSRICWLVTAIFGAGKFGRLKSLAAGVCRWFRRVKEKCSESRGQQFSLFHTTSTLFEIRRKWLDRHVSGKFPSCKAKCDLLWPWNVLLTGCRTERQPQNYSFVCKDAACTAKNHTEQAVVAWRQHQL